jgi:hypothetical protein
LPRLETLPLLCFLGARFNPVEITPLFSSTAKTSEDGRNIAIYQHRPEIILDPLWALPDFTMHSLGDPENALSQEESVLPNMGQV